MINRSVPSHHPSIYPNGEFLTSTVCAGIGFKESVNGIAAWPPYQTARARKPSWNGLRARWRTWRPATPQGAGPPQNRYEWEEFGASPFSSAHHCNNLSVERLSGTSATLSVPRFCALADLVRMGGGSGNGTSGRYWWQWGGVASKGPTPLKKRYIVGCCVQKVARRYACFSFGPTFSEPSLVVEFFSESIPDSVFDQADNVVIPTLTNLSLTVQLGYMRTTYLINPLHSFSQLHSFDARGSRLRSC